MISHGRAVKDEPFEIHILNHCIAGSMEEWRAKASTSMARATHVTR